MWNQMTDLRFQTGGRHQTPPASLRGRDINSKRQQEMGEKETDRQMERGGGYGG